MEICIFYYIHVLTGDTLDGVNGSFWEESLLNNYPIAIEPEVMYSNYQYLAYNVMSWGYWTITSPLPLNPVVPKVSTYKAITKGNFLKRDFIHGSSRT